MPLKTVVIYGSVRDNRQGIKAAHFVINMLKERGHKVTFIDPLEYNLPLMNKRYKFYEPGKAPEKLSKLAKIFTSADAFVIVTGEYNHAIPPALTNILDYFLEEYFWRPSAIVSYASGRFGGVRAAVQLRAMLGELGMSSIPSIYSIPKIREQFDDQGNALDEKHTERIQRFLDELEWYANALKQARKQGAPY